jgi:toxin FitB
VVAPATGFLLDTNVISELMKRRAHRGVVAWIDGTAEPLLHLSVITIGEIRKGIYLVDEADPRRAALEHGLTLVTRNTSDLAPTGVPLFDPWSTRG